MDKQKQIEEMARVICGFACDYEKCEICPFNCINAPCEHHDYAINLINAGYRKIPEGAAAFIDRKLFNEIANDILLSVKPVYLRKEIVCKMLDLIDRLMVQTRKETAEKFAKMLKAEIVDFDELRCIQVFEFVDEICKEITEGKV